MTARLDILLLHALCLLLAVTAGSCSQIYDAEGPCEQDSGHGDRVSFKFKIYTDEVKTASRALGVWEEDPANVAERILNPNDMRVLVLNADGQIIKSVKPVALEYNDGISGDGYYDIAVSFEDDYFDSLDDNATITFRLMILANINSIGGIYTTDAMTPGTLFEKLHETFTMSPDWFPSATRGIPMFGYMEEIKERKSDLMNYGGVYVGDIDMQRAMCKVEVSDKIVNAKVAADGLKYPRVTGVEMTSWRDRGNLRPFNLSYASLKTANIPNPTSAPTITTVQATYIDDDGAGVYRFYCPEAHLAEVAFRVAAILAPGEETKYYDVSLAQYADGGMPNPIFGNDMVRNHIYRFDVNSFNTIADLTLTVADWGHQIDEYTIDDIIEMESDGFLQWTYADPDAFAVSTETYNGKEEQMLSMLNGTTDYATGTFHIKSPMGAAWKAYFIPGENGVDAFEFVDADADGNVVAGSERSFAEGPVGVRSTIHIRGKGAADNYRHTAELVVEVRQPDGTVLYAPLTVRNSSRFIIYRENKL